jgi:LysM repeat protein
MSISSSISPTTTTTTTRPPARPAQANTSSLEVPSESPTENSTDSVALSEESDPFQSLGAGSTQVEVEAWSGDRAPAEGQISRNDHLEGILRNNGYSVEDIYRPDQDGKTLLDRVAEVNDLDDPNLLQPGQRLVVPTAEAPEQESFDALLGGLMDNYSLGMPETPENPPAAPSADVAPELGQTPDQPAAPAADSPPERLAPPVPAEVEESFPTLVGEQASVVAETQGEGAEAVIDAAGTAVVADDGAGNTINYEARGQSIMFDGRAHTGSFNGVFNAIGEENHLSGQLAAEGVNSAQLGSGADSARFLSFGDGDQRFDVFKNGGSFVMPNNTGAAEGARTQLGIWAPGTEVAGYTNGGLSSDNWTIDAGSLADGTGVNGRAGQDSLTVRVPVGQLPAIRTENNWFSDQYLVSPENGNGSTFDALNLENLCVYEGDTLAAGIGDCDPTWAGQTGS